MLEAICNCCQLCALVQNTKSPLRHLLLLLRFRCFRRHVGRETREARKGPLGLDAVRSKKPRSLVTMSETGTRGLVFVLALDFQRFLGTLFVVWLTTVPTICASQLDYKKSILLHVSMTLPWHCLDSSRSLRGIAVILTRHCQLVSHCHGIVAWHCTAIALKSHGTAMVAMARP